MAVSLKHNFVSPVADEGNADEVSPNDWNAEHAITMATAKVLGRTTAGEGAVEELDFLDEDNMASDSATAVATQQSIKAYVDATAAGRTLLTANTTFYVRTDGNDSNDGTANTSAGAKLTIQAMLDTLAQDWDLQAFTATVQIGNGTYTAGASTVGYIYNGSLIIQGNTADRTDVVVQGIFNLRHTGDTTLQYIQLESDQFSGITNGIVLGNLTVQHIEWVSPNNYAALITTLTYSSTLIDNNFAITNNFGAFVFGFGGEVTGQGITLTLNSTPSMYYAFLQLSRGTHCPNWGSNTVTGTATGQPVRVEEGSSISISTTNLGTVPGNATPTLIMDVSSNGSGSGASSKYAEAWTLSEDGSLSLDGGGTLGYGTGSGGTVMQATNKATGVTLSEPSGQITMNGAALAANTIVSFTLTNTLIAATDVLVLNHAATGTVGAYALNAQPGAGSAVINVHNLTGGSLSEAIVINFTLVKGASS